MADPKIRLKRSSVENKIPTPDQVPLGEIALNTYDGYLYASKNVGIGTTVIAINPFRVGTGTNTYNAYFTAGNVGIGSEIPTTKLDVDGTVTATSFAGSGANLTGLTGASAATYGSTGLTPVITVDANGRITGITTVTTSGSGGGIAQISDDTTPQLGGNLDLNSKDITGTGNVNITGVVTATSFVGNLSGIATGATRVYVDESADDNANHNLVFINAVTPSSPDTQGDAYLELEIDTNGISFNPSTNTLNVNNVAGIATGATRVYVDESEDDDNDYNIIFTDVTPGSGNQYYTLQVDDNGLKFNPGTNTFSVSGIQGTSYVRSKKYHNHDDISTLIDFSDGGDILLQTGNTTRVAIGTDGYTTINNGLNVTGVATATGFSTSGGTSSQFLKADGSVDTSTYITSADGGNAATLGGISSTSFLRSDEISTKTSGALKFNDTVHARFGTNGDLRIYHSGTASFIEQNGTATGPLNIRQAIDDADVVIQSDNGSGGTTQYIRADGSSGEAVLYHYGSEKLATKSNGIDVTGHTETDTLNVSGIATAVGFATANGTSSQFLKADGSVDGSTYLTSYTETDPVVAAINGIVKSDGTTISAATAGTDYLTDISQDTTPQLGGNLDLNSKDITGTGNLNITGVATFSGNVTIGGTLTYEDVTNIDSVGLVTARSGINVSAGGVNVTGVSTFQDHVHLGDDDQIIMGDGQDLKIYHNSNNGNSIIGEYGSGNLHINADDLQIKNSVSTEVKAKFITNGAVELYHDNSKKLETTSDGIIVTGINTADAFAGFDYLKAPHGTTVNYAVTVAAKTAAHRYNGSGSSNGYLIDGVESPFLTFTPGRTYRFTLSSSDMTSHPFRFYLEADKTTAYTTNVTSTGTYTEIVVTDTTPTVLHYQCSAHGYMGNAVQVNSNKVNTPYQIDGLKGANITGVTTSTSFVKSSNSGGFLKADGTEDTNTYLTSLGTAIVDGDFTSNGFMKRTGAGTYAVDSNTYLTSYTETDPVVGAINGIVKANGSGTISTATAGHDYLTPSGDGSGLTGLTGASAATYGSAGATPVIVVDSDGRITGISTVATSGSGGGGGISNVVEDTTPQLGGTLETNGNLIDFGDSSGATDDRLRFGAGQDLQIWHNGANSYIAQQSDVGDLYLTSSNDDNDVVIQTDNGSGSTTDYFRADGSTGEAKLFYYGSEKIKTVNTGVTITGTATATEFSGGGSNLTGLTGASAATYGSSTVTPVITVDANGRITTISTATISGGGGGSSSTRTVNRYVATQSQTLFPPSGTISYSVGYLDVYLNGSRLDTTEFTATNGTTVTLGTGASANDVVELVAFTNVSLTNVTVVNDTSPQLGGNLDLNSNNITGTGNINITGTATVSGSQVATQNDAIAFAIALG